MNDISVEFGERLRFLRREQKLSQEQLAFKAEINTTFLGHIERGTKRPTLDTIAKLAAALGLSLTELFDFASNTEGSVVETMATVTPYASSLSRIVSELKKCSPDELESIYIIVKQLIYLKNKR